MLPGRVIVICAAVALASCNAKTAHQAADAGGAGSVVEPGAGEGGVASPSAGTAGLGCSDCPSAEHVDLCCEEYCGYLNVETEHCEPSRAGARVLDIVGARGGSLCPARTNCQSDAACPADQPDEGAPCTGAITCNYCAALSIPRAVGCRQRLWKTLGPNAPCGYTVEP